MVESVGSSTVLAASNLTPAAFGLVGTLLGGVIAGAVSLLVAHRARQAAERSWVRDNRRNIYERFLTHGQELLGACEALADSDKSSAEAVQRAFLDFFQVYVVVQAVGELDVVEESRIYGYRLWELRDEAKGQDGVLKPPDFQRVSELVRYARHKTIDAMRTELGLNEICPRPPDPFNAFVGTDLEDRFVSRERKPAEAHAGESASGSRRHPPPGSLP